MCSVQSPACLWRIKDRRQISGRWINFHSGKAQARLRPDQVTSPSSLLWGTSAIPWRRVTFNKLQVSNASVSRHLLPYQNLM